MTDGAPAPRPPLLLLPGTLCDARLWAHQAQGLADLAAPRVVHLTRDDSIAAMAARVLDEAPPRFLLAGLSMGGIVAFEVVRQAPQRVIAAAFLDTNPGPAEREQIDAWREEIALVRGGRFAQFLEERWIPALLAAGGPTAPALRETIRAMARAIGPDAFVRQTEAQIGRADSRPSLPAITSPTLVLCGRDDVLCPPDLHAAMAAALPAALLVVVDDCGHLSTLEQPAAVTAHLRAWIDQARRHAAALGGIAASARHA